MPKRRTRGGGSVYYAKKAGRWEAVVTVTDPDTGRRRRVKQIAHTRAEAEAQLAQMLAERRGTGTVARRDVTVADAINDLLRYPPATWKSEATKAVNALHAARLTAALGSVPLARLRPGQIERHLLAEIMRPRRPLSAGTVRDELYLLRRAVHRAQREGLVAQNAAALARVPAGAATRQSRSMTAQEVAKLLATDMAPFWRAWLSVALMLGLRPGEIAGLAWEDIGDDGVLRIRQGLHATADGLVRGGLKTASSRRSLLMPQAVTDTLTAWRAEQLTQQLACPVWEGTGLVFTDGFGRPLSRQKIHYGFRKLCKAAGIGGDWHDHMLPA